MVQLEFAETYKRSVNPVLEIDRYLLPEIEDLLVKLAGGVIFSKLNLSRAYKHWLWMRNHKNTQQ